MEGVIGMKKYVELLVIVLSSAFILLACSNGDGTISQGAVNEGASNPVATPTSLISGSAVKGPVSGAEMKLYYLGEDGSEIEIVADNAPVLTTSTGGFDFQGLAAQSLNFSEKETHCNLCPILPGAALRLVPAPS